MQTTRWCGALAALTAASALCLPCLAQTPTVRASVTAGGAQGTGQSWYPALSSNGASVAFESSSPNLVSGDTNTSFDIFLKSLQTGAIVRVSVATDGTEAAGSSSSAAVNADGRYVAFVSDAPNLVGSDLNGMPDIFLRDTVQNTTVLVTVAAGGAQADAWSFGPSISADGRTVAFDSMATNLAPGGASGLGDVYVRDMQTGEVAQVSVSSDGAPGNDWSYDAAISADGRAVAFVSGSTNLAPDDTNGKSDIYVHSLLTGATLRASVATGGAQANAGSSAPAISADGRFVAFASDAANLAGGDVNGKTDVFLRDTVGGTTTLVSVASDGTRANGDSYSPSINADGRYVAFHSDASNLVAGDTNGRRDVFVHDMVTGTTTRVSIASDGAQGDADSADGSISGDGKWVAFDSDADNLVADDTNATRDVLVRGPLAAGFTAADVPAALRLAAGITNAPSAETARLDADANGKVSLSDAVRIARALAGLM